MEQLVFFPHSIVEFRAKKNKYCRPIALFPSKTVTNGILKIPSTKYVGLKSQHVHCCELSYIFKFTHSKSFKSKVILSSVKYSSAGVYCVVNEDIET